MWTHLKSRLRDTWLHPRYIAHREIERFLHAEGHSLTGRILDVGCGRKPYSLYFGDVTRHVGVDMPSTVHSRDAVNVWGSALALPFSEAAFDGILCTEVLEHTPDPEQALCEMARVARPGAALLLTVPLSESLHEEPYDFCRFTHHWVQHLLGVTGWSLERIRPRGGAWLELGYRTSSLLYETLGARRDTSGMARPRTVVGPIAVGLCAGVQILSSVMDHWCPSNLGTIGYAVVARRR